MTRESMSAVSAGLVRTCRCPRKWARTGGRGENQPSLCDVCEFFLWPPSAWDDFQWVWAKALEELNPLVQFSNFSDPRGRRYGGANLEVVVRGRDSVTSFLGVCRPRLSSGSGIGRG